MTFSADGTGVDCRQFDAVIAVIGETPYAEGDGDIGPSGTLRHSRRYPADLAVLQRGGGQGQAGGHRVRLRPSAVRQRPAEPVRQAFVAAWLPGTEGKGVADVLVAGKDGKARA